MPLIRIELVKGRNPEQLANLLEAAHRATLIAFRVPERDRYQLIHEHAEDHFVMQDTGLGIVRSTKRVLVTVVTRPRTRDEKLHYYQALCRELSVHCGVDSRDVLISIVTNYDEDWSFGLGKAQFLNGELPIGSDDLIPAESPQARVP